jgi:hypothetical protein
MTAPPRNLWHQILKQFTILFHELQTMVMPLEILNAFVVSSLILWKG